MIAHAFSLLSNYLVLNQIGSSFIGKCASSHLHKFRTLQGASPPDPRPKALPLDRTGGYAPRPPL